MSPAHRFQWRNYGLSLVLAALAGWTDAVAYLYGRGIYVSFMSGNSTELAVYTVGHDAPKIMHVGGVIGCFVAGVVGGELIARSAPRRGRAWVLLTEALLLGTAALITHLGVPALFTLLALALALGTQNASVHQAGEISVALTYVTGTLVRLGRGIAAGLTGTGRWRIPLQYLGLWLALVGGAFMGAAANQRSTVVALAAVSLAALALCLVTLRSAPRPS